MEKDVAGHVVSQCEGTTLIHAAINMGDVELVQNLLKIGISIYEKNCDGDTPVYAAFKAKRYAIVDKILNHVYGPKDGINVQRQQPKLVSLDPLNNDDMRHFHIACIRNNLNVVKLFLRFGFDVNKPFSLNCSPELSQFNPLYYAAIIWENIYMLETLLQHGADLSIRYNFVINCSSNSNSNSNNNSDSNNSNGEGQTLLHAIFYSFFRDPRRISRVFDYANDSVFINCIDDNGLSHFHLCCMTNNPYMVKEFMDRGVVDVNSRTTSSCSRNPGFSPLHFAAYYNCDNVSSLLLECGADCHQVDEHGNTPLHIACAKSGNRLFPLHHQLIVMLLDYGSRPDAVNNKSLTPLHQAFYNDHIKDKVIDAMLSKIPRNVHNNVTDAAGVSFFHIACASNDTGLVKDFLESEAVDIDARVVSEKYKGYAGLHFATWRNKKEVVEILLKCHARVNIPTGECQSTPLHLACNINGKLLESKNFALKSNDEKADDNDLTSVANFDCFSADRKSHFDIIKLLILYGADVEAKDAFENSPLLTVCLMKINYCETERMPYSTHDLNREVNIRMKGIIEILLSEGGANLNARSVSGESALHIILQNHFSENLNELMEFLIKKGADLNATTEDGLTPLHFAVTYKAIEPIKILIKYKADVNSKSKGGKIPLNFFIEFHSESPVEREYENIISILLENGSDVNAMYLNLQGRERTLWLDVATRQKSFLLRQFLDYGADINMEDSFGRPYVLYLFFDWQYVVLNPTSVEEYNTFCTIFIHVKRMLAAGFYVNDQVIDCYLGLYESVKLLFSEASDSKYMDNLDDVCFEELNRLMDEKIDNYASLFSILQSDAHKLSKRIKNSTLLKIVNDPNICDKFPLYGCFIKTRFKKGLERRTVLEFANSSIRKFMNYYRLPDLCCDCILGYLTNEDIANLHAAVIT